MIQQADYIAGHVLGSIGVLVGGDLLDRREPLLRYTSVTVHAHLPRLGFAENRRSDTLLGRICVEAIPLPDLLMHFMIYEAADSEDAAKRRIDHEISQLREATVGGWQ